MTRTELLKTAKPILFNTDMVRSILDGRKTVTRRVLKNQGENAFTYEWNYKDGMKDDVDLICDRNGELYALANKPTCHTGDILYVRETWGRYAAIPSSRPKASYYKADEKKPEIMIWSPSIHMPKEAARIFLRVTNVRVERLQSITEEEAYREGWHGPWCAHQVFDSYHDSAIPCEVSANPNCPIDPPCDHSVPELFGSDIWDKTVKKSDLDRYGWAANPWVWVIEFERVEVPNEQH